MQFCEECGVSNDLHDDVDNCTSAGNRADGIERLDRLFFGIAVR